MSRPVRGGWIEMSLKSMVNGLRSTSRPVRGGWIEIVLYRNGDERPVSRPVRGGWIEMIAETSICSVGRGPVPRVAGGLKCIIGQLDFSLIGSRPARTGGLKYAARSRSTNN